MRNLVHEKAILGDVFYDGIEKVKIIPKAHEPVNPSEAIENIVFNGSYNPLHLFQAMKINHGCRFDVKKFPFDSQICSFIMKLYQRRKNPIRFILNRTAVNKGPLMVDQFTIDRIYDRIKNNITSKIF